MPAKSTAVLTYGTFYFWQITPVYTTVAIENGGQVLSIMAGLTPICVANSGK